MDRRSVLKALMAASLAGSCGRLFAGPAGTPRFLLVFLRGGYDSANLLVPIASDFYYASRPNIAIARPGSGPGSALPLDADWGLHPVMEDSLLPLYQARQLAFVPFAGTDDLTRSHFETQDSIEQGQPAGASRDFRSGFLNRLAGVLNGARPISLTQQLPLVMQGRVSIPNVALRAVGKTNLDARQSRIIAAMYKQTPLAASVSEGFAVRDDVMREMAASKAGEMEAANRNAISTKGFELEARRIARLMKDTYTLGFVDIGGWDTHVGEGGATGYLAGRLDEVGRGLAGFAEEMGPAWRDTVVVVLSEFGRTFRENGNRGTDHGHGSVYWVLGGGIQGGRIAGRQQRVEQATLFQDRDYPVLNEYRALLSGLFARLYGLHSERLAQVFAQTPAQDIGLL